jgi:hypothetical protein
MKLHAGSLYKSYLVLYGELGILSGNPIIKVDDESLQWDMYCNDLEIDLVDWIHKRTATVTYQGNVYTFECLISKDPMKDLGFTS